MRQTQLLSLFLPGHSVVLDSSMSPFIKYYVSSHCMDCNESLEDLKIMSRLVGIYLSVVSRSLNVLASSDFLLDLTAVLAVMQ